MTRSSHKYLGIVISVAAMAGCIQPDFIRRTGPGERHSNAVAGAARAAQGVNDFDAAYRFMISGTVSGKVLSDCARNNNAAYAGRKDSDNDALLQAAWCAYEYLRHDFRFSERVTQQVRDVYNRSAQYFLRAYLQPAAVPRRIPWTVSRPPEVDIEQMEMTRSYRVKNIRVSNRQRGIGATGFWFRSNQADNAADRLFPAEGIARPYTLTFVARASENEIGIDLRFHDSNAQFSARLGQLDHCLNRDPVTPYAYLLDQARLRLLGPTGLLQAEKLESRTGIYLLQRYDPDKSPVVMIHGLNSSPLIWKEISAMIFADPVLASRYQVWHVIYPSGLPFLYSARRLREQMEDVRLSLDPELDDYATNNVTLIGHSMGGLIAKALITDSGDTFWNAMFHDPPQTIPLDAATAAELERIFYFQPRPYVRKVFFIDTPHRGSKKVEAWWAKAASAVIRLPKRFLQLFGFLDEPGKVRLKPQMRPFFSNGVPSSIQTLSPAHPLIQELAAKPLPADIQYYSVIGDSSVEYKEKIHDGFVSFDSAHLEGAWDEIVVYSNHKSYKHSKTLSFVRDNLIDGYNSRLDCRAGSVLPRTPIADDVFRRR